MGAQIDRKMAQSMNRSNKNNIYSNFLLVHEHALVTLLEKRRVIGRRVLLICIPVPFHSVTHQKKCRSLSSTFDQPPPSKQGVLCNRHHSNEVPNVSNRAPRVCACLLAYLWTSSWSSCLDKFCPSNSLIMTPLDSTRIPRVNVTTHGQI